ncbi:hypothetical protein MLD38_032949 [Melastoma candidum]|uniref:Uncharacterized protein n=1 Tax=Melastoma candidum TaxID=119954 RepID=A0ACB9M5M6_9MYRT|nr:hypothetical protein MLD38_032949 [Melastoma candidum]
MLSDRHNKDMKALTREKGSQCDQNPILVKQHPEVTKRAMDEFHTLDNNAFLSYMSLSQISVPMTKCSSSMHFPEQVQPPFLANNSSPPLLIISSCSWVFSHCMH